MKKSVTVAALIALFGVVAAAPAHAASDRVEPVKVGFVKEGDVIYNYTLKGERDPSFKIDTSKFALVWKDGALKTVVEHDAIVDTKRVIEGIEYHARDASAGAWIGGSNATIAVTPGI